jgi:hypothetical protein
MSDDQKHVQLMDQTQDSNADSVEPKEAQTTEKKDFTSSENPNNLKRQFQQGEYMWLGTYAHWLTSGSIK